MDPQYGVNRWQHWAVSGTKDTCVQFFDTLDASLPKGWRRLRGDDLLAYKSLVKEGAGWYSLGTTPTYVGVTLSLEPHGGSELRGGWVRFANHPFENPSPRIAASWEEVIRFLEQGIVPTAKKVGARVSLPTPEEVFFTELPVEMRDCLHKFSKSARKTLPLTREESELWYDFIVAAFRSNIAIDDNLFADWFVSEGWSKEAATELTQRFFDQCLLLTKYTDLVSVA